MEIGNDFLDVRRINILHFLQEHTEGSSCMVESIRLIRDIQRIHALKVGQHPPAAGIIPQVRTAVFGCADLLHRAFAAAAGQQ